MNRVVLVGRLTKDPELRTAGSAPVVNFSIAINRPFTSNSGVREADFINCVVFNKQAENLSRYMRKGNLVGVEGRLQTRSYDAQDGSRRTITEVFCDQISFLESKSSGSSNQTASGYDDEQFNTGYRTPRPEPNRSPYDEQFSQNQQRQKQQDFNEFEKDYGFEDDDLPF